MAISTIPLKLISPLISTFSFFLVDAFLELQHCVRRAQWPLPPPPVPSLSPLSVPSIAQCQPLSIPSLLLLMPPAKA